nr:MAG TPA: hypothetical protein [Caudoviricetes sp.]
MYCLKMEDLKRNIFTIIRIVWRLSATYLTIKIY